MEARKVNAPALARIPAFCHAVIAGDFIYISGTLGTEPGSRDLVTGGTGPETARAMLNIGIILEECGASLPDLIKVDVFLADIQAFSEMNEAYMGVIGEDPPARITVGRAELAMGAAVEIDAIAYKPQA